MNDMQAYLEDLMIRSEMSEDMITEDRLQEMGEALYEEIVVNVVAHMDEDAKEGFSVLMDDDATTEDDLIVYAKSHLPQYDAIVEAVLAKFEKEYLAK